MANAVENALSRASDEQRAKAQAVIEEARRNIKLVSMQQMDDISPTAADAVARNAQVIEECRGPRRERYCGRYNHHSHPRGSQRLRFAHVG